MFLCSEGSGGDKLGFPSSAMTYHQVQYIFMGALPVVLQASRNHA